MRKTIFTLFAAAGLNACSNHPLLPMQTDIPLCMTVTSNLPLSVAPPIKDLSPCPQVYGLEKPKSMPQSPRPLAIISL